MLVDGPMHGVVRDGGMKPPVVQLALGRRAVLTDFEQRKGELPGAVTHLFDGGPFGLLFDPVPVLALQSRRQTPDLSLGERGELAPYGERVLGDEPGGAEPARTIDGTEER